MEQKEKEYKENQEQFKSRAEDKELAKKVKDLYFKEHLTQKEIVDKLGLSQPYVSKLLFNKCFIIVRVDSVKAKKFSRLLNLNNISFSAWAKQKVDDYLDIKK